MSRRPMQNTRPPHHRLVSTDELNEIAEKAAEEAMKKLLGSMGLDASTPDAIIKLQQDFSFLRDARVGTRMMKSKIFGTATAILVTGLVYLIWQALKGPP